VPCWAKYRVRATKVCPRCGKTFPARHSRVIFCSWLCFRAPTMKTCIICGKVFKPGNLKRKACSLACRAEAVSGPRSGRWKGGASPVPSRTDKRYRRWRRIVLTRDGHRCVKCGSTERLETDHIRSWTKYPERRYQPSNGRTLCRKCHHKRRNHGKQLSLSSA
jgi:5-methylcytosine-specific restriction endonuclease McrA